MIFSQKLFSFQEINILFKFVLHLILMKFYFSKCYQNIIATLLLKLLCKIKGQGNKVLKVYIVLQKQEKNVLEIYIDSCSKENWISYARLKLINVLYQVFSDITRKDTESKLTAFNDSFLWYHSYSMLDKMITQYEYTIVTTYTI